ncbi:hypothetical protein [Butyrivibrio sp. AE3004]|uniref:hypothetical protein n=1 Tax=Butyrivibrio sp. AE3004 TaxID=1506994 RepID=UPI000A7BDCA0|nr:hypothetical protein [Butyrivibrio sp. AE3004]
MTDTSNLSGYRSVYMAFGAFSYGMGDNNLKLSGDKGQKAINELSDGGASFISVVNNAARELSADKDGIATGEVKAIEEKPAFSEGIDSETARTINSAKELGYPGTGAFLSYTRIITASIPEDIASAIETGSKASPFDFSSGAQELKITINVSGGSRIYTASGTDKDGNSFSKEIDPYNVDPTDADYSEFATLCAYIRDTEGMADNAMKAVRDAAPQDITEKGNYLYKVGFFAETNGNLSGAKKLFEQMQTFFESLMGIGKVTSGEGQNDSGIVNVRSDSGNGIGSSNTTGGSYHSRILDELQEMIELMMQKMINEILNIDDDASYYSDDAGDVAEVTENAEPSSDASATDQADTIAPESSNSIPDYIDTSNAVTL